MSRPLDQSFIYIQHLENVVAQQARQIEMLKARGPLGFFQRRRLSKEGLFLNRNLTEDQLRQSNLRLKRKVKLLEEELHGRAE